MESLLSVVLLLLLLGLRSEFLWHGLRNPSLVPQLLALIFAVGTESKLKSPSEHCALTQQLGFTGVAEAGVHLREFGIQTFYW